MAFKKLICKAIFQFCFQEAAVQTTERKLSFCQTCSSKPSSHQPVRAKVEMCNPHSSGQVRERVRDRLAVVGGSISSQHQAPVPGDLRWFLLSFSSIADSNGTVPAFTLHTCCTWTVIFTCHGYFMVTKHWFLSFLSQSVDLLRWILSSQCVWCMLKRKTGILQVYLLLLYCPKAV